MRSLRLFGLSLGIALAAASFAPPASAGFDRASAVMKINAASYDGGYVDRALDLAIVSVFGMESAYSSGFSPQLLKPRTAAVVRSPAAAAVMVTSQSGWRSGRLRHLASG